MQPEDAHVPRPLVSVIVPMFNEAAHIAEVHRRVCAALEPITSEFEILFVDDGSRDESVKLVEAARASDPRVGLVEFSRNFGKEFAMLAGYEHARGRAVVVLDGDLQTPPEVIPEMIRAWQGGAEIVDGVRQSTIGQSALRTLASDVFYWLMRKLASADIVPNSVDFRLLDERVVREIRQCRERYRFNRGLVGWVGFARQGVDFVASDRPDGQSRWGVLTLTSYALDAILSFSSLPLRVAGLLGLVISVFSFVYLAWLMVASMAFTQPIKGYATVVGGIFLLGGMQLLTIWLLGEYVGRLYEEVKRRPLYVARRVLGSRCDVAAGSNLPTGATEAGASVPRDLQ